MACQRFSEFGCAGLSALWVQGGLTPYTFRNPNIGRDGSRPTKALTGQRTPKKSAATLDCATAMIRAAGKSISA